MTYQWQCRKKALNQWDDFPHNHNVEVEFNYCDVARSECYVKTEYVSTTNCCQNCIFYFRLYLQLYLRTRLLLCMGLTFVALEF